MVVESVEMANRDCIRSVEMDSRNRESFIASRASRNRESRNRESFIASRVINCQSCGSRVKGFKFFWTDLNPETKCF